MIVQDPEAPGGERAKVLDFGIAKLHEQDLVAGVRTRPDVVFGTPAYMSPEQCRDSSQITPRSDVYSLGVLLYWVIRGRLPFDGSAAEIIGKHVLMPAPPLSVELPVGADALPQLVQAMLAKDPEKRPSMDAVASTLEQVELQLAESLPAPSAGEAGQGARSRSHRSLSALRRVTESASQPALAALEPPAQNRESRRLRLFAVLILIAGWMAARWIGRWVHELIDRSHYIDDTLKPLISSVPFRLISIVAESSTRKTLFMGSPVGGGGRHCLHGSPGAAICPRDRQGLQELERGRDAKRRMFQNNSTRGGPAAATGWRRWCGGWADWRPWRRWACAAASCARPTMRRSSSRMTALVWVDPTSTPAA